MSRLKHWWSWKKNRICAGWLLYDYEEDLIDQFGVDEEKYKFKFYLRITKVWTFSGFSYGFQVPNYTHYDKNLYRGIANVISYINSHGVPLERLTDECKRRDFWKRLGR